ncbi:kin of IRRE-like protein 1 [Ptychodera flava]|uniref:kin of IRRE-like protein 1 n=1 Tax=Ptychodera flava TaxID=63121 RepID=UPI00396A383D
MIAKWSFVACYCLVFCWSPGQAVPRIEASPADTAVKEGADVTLACTIADKDDYEVFWIITLGDAQTPIAIGPDENRNTAVYPRYTFDGDADSGDYSMGITDFSNDDAGIYTCFLKSPSNIPEDNLQISATVSLSPPDPPTDVTCTATNLRFGANVAANTEGTLVGLSCVVTGGDPGAVAQWFRDGSLMPGQNQTVVDEGQNVVTSVVEWVLSPIDNLATYTCVVNHPGWVESHGCPQTFSDLYLTFSPVVKIYPPWQYIERNYPATLVCNATAVPSDCTYRWFYNGRTITDDLTGFNVSSDASHSTLTFLSVSTDDYINDIICEGTNSMGSSIKTAVILNPEDDDPVKNAITFQYMLIIVVVVLGVLFLVALIVCCCVFAQKSKDERRKNDPNRQDGYTLNEVDGVDSVNRQNDGIDYNQFQGGAESRMDDETDGGSIQRLDSTKLNNAEDVEAMYATPHKGSTRSEASSIEDNTAVTPDDVEVNDQSTGGHVLY